MPESKTDKEQIAEQLESVLAWLKNPENVSNKCPRPCEQVKELTKIVQEGNGHPPLTETVHDLATEIKTLRTVVDSNREVLLAKIDQNFGTRVAQFDNLANKIDLTHQMFEDFKLSHQDEDKFKRNVVLEKVKVGWDIKKSVSVGVALCVLGVIGAVGEKYFSNKMEITDERIAAIVEKVMDVKQKITEFKPATKLPVDNIKNDIKNN